MWATTRSSHGASMLQPAKELVREMANSVAASPLFATNGDCPNTFLTPGTCVTGECWLERSITCSSDAECPACVPGKGGGVTTTPAASADGNDVYMASVGCLSFPSIGNSDSIFKLDAATGAIDWVYRTEAPEQFQSFVGGPTYHDYGFLNGPLLLETEDDRGRPTTLVVSGSKDGTLYAFDEGDGDIAWKNEVVPLPTPPGFAGFGLFNGAIAYENGRIYAALFRHIPATNPEPKHLMAFDVRRSPGPLTFVSSRRSFGRLLTR